jgi:flagellar basal body-associated protein FliL
MNETEILTKVTLLESKVAQLEATIKKGKKYLLIFIIVSAVLFIVPLIGLLFAIPSFLDTYSEISNISI